MSANVEEFDQAGDGEFDQLVIEEEHVWRGASADDYLVGLAQLAVEVEIGEGECANLFVGREDGEARARGLVLVRGAQRPEGNRTAAELREPALELGLRGVVGQASHVQDLAALRQESAHVSASVHGAGEHVGVLVGWLGLVDQSAEDTCEGDGLLHGAAGRCGSQGLQVEGQVVLDGGAGGDGLNLEGGTDVGEHGWTEWQGFGVVLLPSLVLGAEVECA